VDRLRPFENALSLRATSLGAALRQRTLEQVGVRASSGGAQRSARPTSATAIQGVGTLPRCNASHGFLRNLGRTLEDLRRLFAFAICVAGLSARAEYHYFSNVQSGSDGIVQEVRWPYWNSAYYNTWLSDDWTSSEGVSGYFYSGLALPAAGSPNPVGTRQTLNWSFWPLSNPVSITDTISSGYTSPTTFSMQTIGEGTIFRSPGTWRLWQTNVWYRMAFRAWLPVNGPPHLGFAGIWMRDPVAGVWYHQATVQLPFAVTGIDGLMGFQENATGGTQPQRTDYRACYYHKNGAWNSGNQFYVYNHGGGVENVGLIETNTAVYYETCENNGVYTGTITNVGQSSPTFTITQPATPTFDPLVVTNYGASVSGHQLLVQWQMPATSSPQFAYQISVYTNSSYTGTAALTSYDIAPDTQEKLLDIGTMATPYARLTIIDIFGQTNGPIDLTPTNASLSAGTAAPGAVNGLNYGYYQSASDYTSDSSTNWSAMPNFAALTPVSTGAVNGLDLTPRRRRNGYAFNYTGYLEVPSNGLYAFTLNSDAGSKLYVDGQLVINWDGEHSPADLSNWIGLQAGFHTLNVQYFCDTEPTSLFGDFFDTLSLSYEGPGLARTPVPGAALYRVPGGSEPAITLASPANGTTLSGASVPLSATVTTDGNPINKVQFYVGNYYWAQAGAAPYAANAFLWAAANNPLRARLIYNNTNSLDSPVSLVTTTNLTLAPWQFAQIFYHNEPNGAGIQNGTYSLVGDGMNLLTRPVSGDCTLIAHLAGLTSTATAPDGSSANSGWQAGIILRGTTNMTPGYPWGQTTTAPFTAVFGQVDGGAYYQNETMVNGGGGYSSGNLGGQRWFKIQRIGNTFTSSVSSDGTTWTSVNTNTLSDFGTTLYAGFFTYAGPSSNPNVHWASFDNVSLTGNLLGPPGVTITAHSGAVYAGQTTALTSTPSGNAPFAYQWEFNGVDVAGATTATLILTNVQPQASGLYAVVLNNSNGTATATSTLTVLTPSLAVAAILSNNPVGYWRLNEAVGPIAYDSAGNFNGTGEGGIVFAVPGVTNSPFTGFENNHLAAQFDGADSDVAIPALNLNTNAITITGWVKRSGAQTAWSGLVFCRSGGTTAGLHFGTSDELRYTWNNSGSTYNWNSGLTVPDGVWTFVALVIQPSQGIIYMATNATLSSAVNAVANVAQAFAGTTYLGYDPNSAARRLNGALDEVAIFNRALTPQQISQILAASLGSTPPSVNLAAPGNGASFGAPATINLAASVAANGHAITQVQFYNGPALLGGSATAPYALAWTNVPAGDYTLLAQVFYDSDSSAWSSPVFITVSPLPSAPAAVTATALANNLISVSWGAAANATGYVVSRGGVPVAFVPGTNYLDLGVSPNTTYCYSIVASNAFGSSPSSLSNCTTTPSGTVAALEWDAGASAAGAEDGDGNWGSSGASWWNGSAAVAWADNSLSVFGAGTSTNCSVLLTDDVTPSGVLFNANNGGSYNISSGGGGLNLAGTPTIAANNDATISAYLKGGGLVKAGLGMLTLTVANTNTGPITVNGGRLVSTVSCWYTPRGIGSGLLTVNSGSVAEFTATHGFGADASGRSATLNGGTLQFDRENYVSGLALTAGSVIGSGELRTVGGAVYTINPATNPSVLSLTLNFVGAPSFNVGRGSGPVDLLVTGSGYNSAGFTKSGAGLMCCTGNLTNSGATTLNAGTLQVDGSLGSNSVTVQNSATLAGGGFINGPTIVQAGGTLSPGDRSIGTLTFGSSLTLSSGSQTVMEISKSGTGLTNDSAAVSGALTLGGSLSVTNTGTNGLAAGDSFKLFGAGTFAGGFASLALPVLATNLVWDATKVATNGTIAVASLPGSKNPPVSPVFTGLSMAANGSFALNGTGAVGQAEVLLTASNLALPVAWTPIATNYADTNGRFTFTDAQATNWHQRFYRIIVP